MFFVLDILLYSVIYIISLVEVMFTDRSENYHMKMYGLDFKYTSTHYTTMLFFCHKSTAEEGHQTYLQTSINILSNTFPIFLAMKADSVKIYSRISVYFRLHFYGQEPKLRKNTSHVT